MTYWNRNRKTTRESRRYARRVPVLGFAVHGKKQERAHGGCLWLRKATKDVASCEKPR